MFVRAGGAAVVNDIEGLLTSSHIEVFLCKKEYYQGHVYQEQWIGGMIDWVKLFMNLVSAWLKADSTQMPPPWKETKMGSFA
ncbi:hypothetical protein D5086_016757 [Populus alba]|uniref:Uncharacterized protein n=1 Tax=Populus alba TaxID=43335 RepID=A0ACC4BUZ3_POPAL